MDPSSLDQGSEIRIYEVIVNLFPTNILICIRIQKNESPYSNSISNISSSSQKDKELKEFIEEFEDKKNEKSLKEKSICLKKELSKKSVEKKFHPNTIYSASIQKNEIHKCGKNLEKIFKDRIERMFNDLNENTIDVNFENNILKMHFYIYGEKSGKEEVGCLEFENKDLRFKKIQSEMEANKQKLRTSLEESSNEPSTEFSNYPPVTTSKSSIQPSCSYPPHEDNLFKSERYPSSPFSEPQIFKDQPFFSESFLSTNFAFSVTILQRKTEDKRLEIGISEKKQGIKRSKNNIYLNNEGKFFISEKELEIDSSKNLSFKKGDTILVSGDLDKKEIKFEVIGKSSRTISFKDKLTVDQWAVKVHLNKEDKVEMK